MWNPRSHQASIVHALALELALKLTLRPDLGPALRQGRQFTGWLGYSAYGAHFSQAGPLDLSNQSEVPPLPPSRLVEARTTSFGLLTSTTVSASVLIPTVE